MRFVLPWHPPYIPAKAAKNWAKLRADLHAIVTCPLALISQLPRSGGTYLSQLFDNHPQVWAHPHELKLGYPEKWNWPDLTRVRSPEEAFGLLLEKPFRDFSRLGGYRKGGDQTLPMLFSTTLQREMFLALCRKEPPQSNREWLNIYFTSFFASWLDHCRNEPEKRVITAFASWLALSPDSMSWFRQSYPDGYLISIIREPLGWYASVKARTLTQPGTRRRSYSVREPLRPYADLEQAELAYVANGKSISENGAGFGSRFILLDYATLTSETEATLRAVARTLDIEYHPVLCRQTFNGLDIQPNTSFKGSAGASKDSILDEQETKRISEGLMMQTYKEVSRFTNR